MKLGTLILLLLSFSLVIACQCKRYAYSTYANSDGPTSNERPGYLFEICKGLECGIVLPYLPKYYTREYKLPNDSVVSGNWAGVNIHDLKKDTAYSILVGKGSEFWAGKCKFKVLEVEPRQLLTKDSTDLILPHVKFQLLKLPKFCSCQNKKLKELDLEQKD
jgi:hypothetical protein